MKKVRITKLYALISINVFYVRKLVFVIDQLVCDSTKLLKITNTGDYINFASLSIYCRDNVLFFTKEDN